MVLSDQDRCRGGLRKVIVQATYRPRENHTPPGATSTGIGRSSVIQLRSAMLADHRQDSRRVRQAHRPDTPWTATLKHIEPRVGFDLLQLKGRVQNIATSVLDFVGWERSDPHQSRLSPADPDAKPLVGLHRSKNSIAPRATCLQADRSVGSADVACSMWPACGLFNRRLSAGFFVGPVPGAKHD